MKTVLFCMSPEDFMLTKMVSSKSVSSGLSGVVPWLFFFSVALLCHVWLCYEAIKCDFLGWHAHNESIVIKRLQDTMRLFS